MKIISGFMAALFLFSVAVQYNDPDPLGWMIAYTVPAALSIAACLGRYPFRVTAVTTVVFAVAMLFWIPELVGARAATFTSMGMESRIDEEAREGLGLLICLVWSGVLSREAWRRSRG